jgi:DNA-directed RNA polymerase subunit RPC12/RpoP
MVNYTLNGVVYSVDNGAVLLCFGVFFVVSLAWLLLDMEIKRRAWGEGEVLGYPKRGINMGEIEHNAEDIKGGVLGVVSDSVISVKSVPNVFVCGRCGHTWRPKRNNLVQCPQCKKKVLLSKTDRQ